MGYDVDQEGYSLDTFESDHVDDLRDLLNKLSGEKLADIEGNQWRALTTFYFSGNLFWAPKS